MSRRHSKKNRAEKKRVEKELAEREASREATTGEGTVENPPAAAAHASLKPATIPENKASPEAAPKASSEAFREGKPSGAPCATTACAGDAEPDRESPLSGKEEQTEKDQKEGKPEEPEALGTQEAKKADAGASADAASERNAGECAKSETDEAHPDKEATPGEEKRASHEAVRSGKPARLLRRLCALIAFVILLLALGAFAWMKVERCSIASPRR